MRRKFLHIFFEVGEFWTTIDHIGHLEKMHVKKYLPQRKKT